MELQHTQAATQEFDYQPDCFHRHACRISWIQIAQKPVSDHLPTQSYTTVESHPTFETKILKTSKRVPQRRITVFNHLLRDSGSTVLTATGFVNRKPWFSTTTNSPPPNQSHNICHRWLSRRPLYLNTKFGANPSTRGGLCANRWNITMIFVYLLTLDYNGKDIGNANTNW